MRRPTVASSLPYGSGWPSRPPRPAGSPQLNVVFLRPTAEQGRHGPVLLPAAGSTRRGRRARARLAGSWPMAGGDFSLGVVVRPVGESGRRPEVACCSSSSLGVVLQSRRPQIGVVDVALCSVGEELALWPRGPGCRMEEGTLFKGRLVRLDSNNSATKETEKKDR